MSQFKVICHHYAAKGNKIACQLLDLPIKAEAISSQRILGSIYVLHDADNHAYKIGFTTALDKRKRTHKTSNPFLELVMQFDCKRIENEQLLHRQLKKFRVTGTSEWYYAHEDLIPTINLLMSSNS